MKPHIYLDHLAYLIAQCFAAQDAAEHIITKYFFEHKQLGKRERLLLKASVYYWLRFRPIFDEALAHIIALHPRYAKHRVIAAIAWQGEEQWIKQSYTKPNDAAFLVTLAQTRNTLINEDKIKQHHWCLPFWFYQKLCENTQAYGEVLARSLLCSAKLYLRCNTLKISRKELIEQLHSESINAKAVMLTPWCIEVGGYPALEKLHSFQQGFFEVQDAGSQLLAYLVAAKRREVIVDFCAGACGKTLAIGAHMSNTGRIYAFDTHAARLHRGKARIARSGLQNIYSLAITHERENRVLKLTQKADRVLVDAPCSGSGTLMRDPSLKWRTEPQMLTQMANKQLQILQAAALLPKVGGLLFYATCSLFAEENQELIQRFLASQNNYELEPSWYDELQELLKGYVLDRGQLNIYSHVHHTDSYFIACMRRTTV